MSNKYILKHSKNVQNIKYFLLATSVAILFIFLFILIKKAPDERLTISYVESADGDVLMKITDTFLYGFDMKNQGFKIHAKSGIQKDSHNINFKNLEGEILLNDKSTVHIESEKCDLNTESQVLLLNGNVKIKSTKGISGFSDSIFISLHNKDIWGEDTININTTSGKIKANSFSYESRNGIIRFKGNVVTVIN